jgi:hypothetical protein
MMHPLMSLQRSMIVYDFHILGVARQPPEANAPLVVDPYAHLPCPLSFQCFEPISRWVAQVLDGRRGIQLTQLADPRT